MRKLRFWGIKWCSPDHVLLLLNEICPGKPDSPWTLLWPDLSSWGCDVRSSQVIKQMNRISAPCLMSSVVLIVFYHPVKEAGLIRLRITIWREMQESNINTISIFYKLKNQIIHFKILCWKIISNKILLKYKSKITKYFFKA